MGMVAVTEDEITSLPTVRSSKELKKRERFIENEIASHGIAVISIMPYEDEQKREESGIHAPYVYSIGLRSFSHPELLLIGLNPQDAGFMLHATHQELIRTGRRFSDGDETPDMVEGPYRISFRELSFEQKMSLTPVAVSYYGNEADAFEVLQIVLPDENGAWPWEKACSETHRLTQNGHAIGTPIEQLPRVRLYALDVRS